MLLAVAAPNSPSDTPQEDTDKFLAGFNGPSPTVTGYAGTQSYSTHTYTYTSTPFYNRAPPNGDAAAWVLLQGLDIAITPHLDDGLEYGGWRNALWFDPLQKYGGFSYYDVSHGSLQIQHTLALMCLALMCLKALMCAHQ
jgi:hypothetical protein